MAGVMGQLVDLDSPATVSGFTRRVPSPVQRLDAFHAPPSALGLRWRPPAGGALISGYRIARTREGRAYETIGETQQSAFFVRDVPMDEAWFYRVTAFNARGSGGFRLVWLCRQSSAGRTLIVPITALPGLRVTVWE